MRLSSLASARPVYYDRNPTITLGSYYASVAPHVTTTRWTITNTAAQKAYCDAASIAMVRDSAAATAGISFAQVSQVSPVTLVFMYSAVLGTTAQQSMGGSIFIPQGGSLFGQTVDNSTGGTITYSLMAHVVQFDA